MKRMCRVIKEWGGFAVGTEINIGEPKASNLKEQGYVEFLSAAEAKAKAKAQAKAKAKAPKKVETATAPPAAETAEVRPDPSAKPLADLKVTSTEKPKTETQK